jgi:hypothetical protein
VPDFADLIRLKDKLDELGHATCGIGHGFCYSLYVRDPNGMLLEFVADPASELGLVEAAAATAHEELEKWRRRDYSRNNHQRATMNYPLPTSPLAQIRQVITGDAGR